MNVLTRGLDAVEWLIRQVIFLFYVAVVAIVTFQVLNRFLLHWPIVWLSDLAIICFIWLGFLTAALAVRHNGHFRMLLLLDLVGPGALRLALELVSIAVGALVFGLFAWAGWSMALRGLREVAPGLQLPMTWAYASVPVAGAVALLFLVEVTVRTARGEAIGAPPADETEGE